MECLEYTYGSLRYPAGTSSFLEGLRTTTPVTAWVASSRGVNLARSCFELNALVSTYELKKFKKKKIKKKRKNWLHELVNLHINKQLALLPTSTHNVICGMYCGERQCSLYSHSQCTLCIYRWLKTLTVIMSVCQCCKAKGDIIIGRDHL